jgi:opacity protein-like surface antigen
MIYLIFYACSQQLQPHNNLEETMRRILFIMFASPAALSPQLAMAQDTNWSGPYVGVTAGATEATTQNVDNWCWGACDGPTIKAIKPTFGATIGANQQIDSGLVIGVEADFNTGGSKSVITPSSRTADPMPVFKWTADYKWTASLRGRVGMTSGNSMVYVTGGYSIAKVDLNEDTQNYPPFRSHPGPFGARWIGTLPGFTYGVGVEHSFGRASVKAELLHASYSVRSACYADTVGPTAGQCFADFSPEPATLSFVPSSTAVRVGFNYSF